MKISFEKLVVTERIRKNLGNLDELTKSIEKVGLLNPIIINSELQLISGLRRLEACKKLGWSEIEATMIEVDDVVINPATFSIASLRKVLCSKMPGLS